MNQPTSAATSSRKRPRHFHQGPDEAEEEQREEEAAAAQPPVARLYRHALESIFGFLSLADLSRVLAVSRPWSAAVGSMRCINTKVASIPAAHPLFELCASRLARHIGTLGSENKSIVVSQGDLYLAGTRMTGLHALFYKLPSPLVGPLLFPPSLTNLTVDPFGLPAREANAMIKAASRLPNLMSLKVCYSKLQPLLDFAPLRHSTQLHTLALDLVVTQNLSLQQADDLRTIPNLTYLDLPLQASDMRLLLRAPHQLQLQKLNLTGPLDAEIGGLLSSLPRLTNLCASDATSFSFLNSLPNLRILQLDTLALPEPLPEPEQMMGGGQCSKLTSLTIWTSELTAAHVGALLSRMPAVCWLTLIDMPRLESLSFLSSSEPLATTLNGITLKDCRHPQLRAEELHHLYSLQKLTWLVINNCFSERLDSFTLKEFKPPSRHFPKLATFIVKGSDPAEGDGGEGHE